MRLSCCEDGVDQVEAQLARICTQINVPVKASELSPTRLDVRHFDRADIANGVAFDRRCIKSQKLPPPPRALRAFLSHRSKPILPKHSAHLAWRLLRERILLKKTEYVAIVGK